MSWPTSAVRVHWYADKVGVFWLGGCQLKLHDTSTAEAQHSTLAADTGILELQGAFLPGCNPLRRGKVHRLAPEVFFCRETPTRLKVFWNFQACVGCGPATGTHKKGLVLKSSVHEALDKYQ